MEELEYDMKFHVAKQIHWPKAHIHRSTVLAACGMDRMGDPFWAWVTAAKRRDNGLQLSFYIGIENVSGYECSFGEKFETRERVETTTVFSWVEARTWLKTLNTLRSQVEDHTIEELDQLKSPFQDLRPAWF